RARAILGRREGVVVDPTYEHSVRAYRREPTGRHVALREDDVAAVRIDGVRVVPGLRQTDFAATPDKAAGVRALCELFDAPLAFAIGDSAEDAPMLRAAAHAFVPAQGSAGLPGARMRHRYQAGLREAVDRFLGERAPSPRLTPEAQLLHAALRAKDDRELAKIVGAARFVLATSRIRRPSEAVVEVADLRARA
ncbi:MAG: hypothetical protein JOY72_02525, partial [Actinobacteria bacterium]|nr:hypothetical protein [Actinomycetota bacterium]